MLIRLSDQPFHLTKLNSTYPGQVVKKHWFYTLRDFEDNYSNQIYNLVKTIDKELNPL